MSSKKSSPPYLRNQPSYDFEAGQAFLDSLDAAEPQSSVKSNDKKSSAGFLRTAGDIGIKLGQGTVDLGSSVVGLGNLASGGLIGRGMRAIGYDPKATNEALGEYLSDAQKQADENVGKADGFVDSIGKHIENPRAILGGISQSTPGMFAGMGVSGALAKSIGLKAALSTTEGAAVHAAQLQAGKSSAQAAAAALSTESGKVAASQAIKAAGTRLIGAGAGTEGLQTAGKIADDAQAAGRDYSDYALPALGAGAVNTAVSFGSGKLFGDAATQIATGSGTGVKGGIIARGAKGFLTEGLVEEAPQSYAEQVFTNIANGEKDITKGASTAAGAGFIIGGAQGGGMAMAQGRPKVPETGALSRAANIGIDAENAQTAQAADASQGAGKFTGMDSLISAVQNDDNPSLVREIAQRQVQEQINQPELIEGMPANFAELLQQSNQQREQERIETRESWEGAKEQAAIELAEQDRLDQENRLRLPAPDMPMPEGVLIDDNGTLRPQTYQDAAESQVAAAQREELGKSVPYGERGGIENVSVPSSPSIPEEPAYILHPSGKPFTNKIGAQTRLKQLGGNHTIVPYEGGFAIRNNDPQAVTQAQEQEAASGVPDATAGSAQPEPVAIQPGDIMHPSGKPFTVKYPAIMTQRQSGGEIIKVDGGYIVRPPKQPSLEEIVAESQSEPTYEKGKTGAETARNKLDAENPFLSFLAKYGLKIDERSDVGGERGKARLIPGHGPLFRQNGLRLDELAQMAKEAGFLSQEQIDSETDNGGVNALSDMIGQALNNEVIPKVQSEPEVNPDVEMLNEAKRVGLDVAGKTPDQVYDMLKAYHDQADTSANTAPKLVSIESATIGPANNDYDSKIIVPAREAVKTGNATKANLKDGSSVHLVNMEDGDGVRTIVAVSDAGDVVGSLGYTTSPGSNPDVYVNEEFQRQGIATAMYDLAEATGGVIPPVDADNALRTEAGTSFRKARAGIQDNLDPVSQNQGLVWNTAVELFNDLSLEAQELAREYNLHELYFDIEELENAETNDTGSQGQASEPVNGGTIQTEEVNRGDNETSAKQAEGVDAAESGSQEGLDPTPIASETDTEAVQDLAKTEAAKPNAPITDFGEKIGGAKKDVWSGFKDRMDEAKGLDVASEPLSKSWPEPNYQALLDNGADPWAVGFMHAARDAVPRKPTKSYKLKSWAAGVETLRNFAADIADGTISTEKVKTEMRKLAGSHSPFHFDDLLNRIELYQAVGHSKSLADVRIGYGEYAMLNGVEYKPSKVIWTVEKKAAATAFSNFPRQLAQGTTKQAAIDDFKAKFSSMEITKPASKEVTFDVFSERGKPGFFVGKKVGRNFITLAGPFDTVKEARAHRNDNQDQLATKLEKAKEIPSERRDTNNPRVGEDMREGKDVTPEMFSNAFGFRGVEFGNYVEQGKRQSDLNEAYDALMDMAALLGIPPKAISLNGTLGLAFGARGSGDTQAAAAHYESNKVVINLTKKSGAGSLGHEWWHALDNYFSRMAQKPGSFMTERLDVNLSAKGSNYLYRDEGVRKEMVDAFGSVIKSIRSTAIKARSSKLDGKRSKQYWTTDVEMSARAFESYLISKLQDNNASNDYLANIVGADTWAAAEKIGFELDDSYPYPTAGEIPAIRAGFDHLFSVIESKETDQGTALFSREGGRRSKFGFDVDELQPIIDQISSTWKNAPKINIVQTIDDLPFDAPNDARGAYFKKQVYLVAANLRDQAQAEAVLLHETLGHAGLSEFFGNGLAPALRSIAMKNRKIAEAAAVWRKSNTDIKGNMSDDRYHLVSIEEALADYVGTGRTINGVEKLLVAIQKGLRAIGLNSVADWMENATDAEVLAMLASARNHIEKGSEFSVFGEQQAQAFSRDKDAPGSKVIIGHPLGEISNHLDYVFAKAGDSESALNIVDDLVNDAYIKKIEDAIGDNDVIIQPVFALEKTGLNQIPLALAGKIAASLDLKVGDKLFQSTSPKRTGLSGLDRIFSRPEFSGDVEKGKKYFLVDDTVTQGGTFSALKSYIESNGGEVVGFSTLTGKQYSATIELSKETLRKIREKHSDVEQKFKAVTGYGFDSLTESEARYLANFEPTESIRNRVDDEYRSKNNSDGNGPLQQEVDPDSLFSRSVTTGDNSRTRTPEQLRAFENVGRTVQVPTLKERFNKMTENLGKKLAQGIVDQFAPIKDLSAEAYGLMRLSKGASGAFEAMLKGGQLKLSDGVYDFDDTKRGGVIDRLLAPLQGESDDFMWWIAGNRADALSTQGKENLFTPSDIKAFKTLADGQTSFDYTIQHGIQKGKKTRDRTTIYNDSLKTFNEFNKNTLDMAEQSGLIDAESRKLWESEFYIPFYRVNEESDDGVRGMNIKSGVVRQQAFKKLKGGSDKLNSDLLENTLMNWAHLLDASAKNRAAKASLEAAAKVGAATPADSSTKKTVWYMDSGDKKYYTVEDPHLLTAIQGLEYAGMRSPIMNAMSVMKHAMTVGVTASPFFKIRNLIRDSVSAIAISGLDYNPGKNIKEGWKLTNQKSDEYFRLLAGGGTIHFGAMLEGSEAKRVRNLVESGVDEGTILRDEGAVKEFYRKHVSPMVDAYNELGNRGESINRASLYDQLIKQGKSHAEASLMARDLMDFSMQGAWTSIRFLTQVVPFMNARLQGLYKLGRSASEDPKRFGIVLGAVAAASISLMLAYSDDDDWKKREDWDRDNFWWFKVGGTAFRIPKPFEIGAIGTLAERGVEYFTQDEMTGERFMDRVKHLMLDSLSMNPIPQMIKPVIDVYANKDSFTGRPIESMSMERLRSDYRFNGSTSMLARAASTAGNAATGDNFLSPVQIDHLIRGYFGWLGTFIVGASDKVARPLTDAPEKATPDYLKVLSGGIVSDVKSSSSRYVAQMYDQAKIVDEAYGTWRMLVKTGKLEEAKEFAADNADKLRLYKGLQNVKRSVSTLNEQIRVVERSNLSSDEKREKISLIQQRKDNIARRASL